MTEIIQPRRDLTCSFHGKLTKEVYRFLLVHGVQYILSEIFSQDDQENYFGRQRAIGSCRVNPSVKDVDYNDNTIKSQYSVRPMAGNVHGGEKWNIIDKYISAKKEKIDFLNVMKRLFL